MIRKRLVVYLGLSTFFLNFIRQSKFPQRNSVEIKNPLFGFVLNPLNVCRYVYICKDTHKNKDKELIRIPYFCHALLVFSTSEGITAFFFVFFSFFIRTHWCFMEFALFYFAELYETNQNSPYLLCYCLFNFVKQKFLHGFSITCVLSLLNVKLFIEAENQLRDKNYKKGTILILNLSRISRLNWICRI